MDQEIFEWLLLLGRWLHIVTAVTWIGTSIFFMWLDRTIQSGELWMVHGGGFYRVQKLMMGPTKVPEHLHWFKWESYWTWFSGIFLLLLIFYTGGGTFLLDSSVSNIGFSQAVAIGAGSIVVSWLFYDFLWERNITKTVPWFGHALTLIWFAGVSYYLCHTLSGRAAFIHIGAMLGTWMTANVFLRIIPRQVKMVAAARKFEPVNQDWANNAKARSTHNTYFTLPVIFIMLSNHFPMTYGHKLNWLILLLVSAAGALIRHYFVIRVQQPAQAKSYCAAGLALLVGIVFFTRTPSAAPEPPAAAYSGPASSTGATGRINGVVTFQDAAPRGEKLSVPLDCSKNHPGGVYSNEISVKNGKLKNVLARITKGVEGRNFGGPPAEAVLLDQRDCMYEPRVIAVRVGQKVDILNSDPLFHNVRTVTTQNENFNVGMAQKNDRITKIFNKPDIVLQTKCDVHPWMSGYIAVVEHPFFGVTGDSGEFAIRELPAGNYTLELWHETLGTQSKEVSLKENETMNMEFAFKKQ